MSMDEKNGRPPIPGFDGVDEQRTEVRETPVAPEGTSPWQADGAQAAPGQGAPTQGAPASGKRHGKERRGVPSIVTGLLGGVVGSGLVTLALWGTGVIGPNNNVASTTDSSAGQTININANTTDAEVAQAVSAKALPSIVSIYVATDSGEGLGSGVILDTDGNIITNNHVVEDATAISVTIDNQSYDATLVGTDASSDLAVIHVDLGDTKVTPIEVGDSDALTVGSWVMTIGSPFGLDQSVSAGIVSSLSRNQMMQSASGNTLYTNLIQTDASINPGNSGGALVDEEGKLVGICTLFSSDTESFAGIGFAIPGNYAVEVANKIIAGETVTHAYIGLSMQTVNAQNAARNNLPVNQGAYVSDVAEGGPAAEAGIKKGDIVTGVEGEEISSADGLILAIRSHKIGETVTVTVNRDGESMDFEVTLGSDEELQRQQQERLDAQNTLDENGNSLGDNGNGGLNGNGGGSQQYSPEEQELLDRYIEYLFNNNRGGSYDLSEDVSGQAK